MPFDQDNHEEEGPKSSYSVRFKPGVSKGPSQAVDICCTGHLGSTLAYIFLHQAVPISTADGEVEVPLEHVESIEITGPAAEVVKQRLDNFNRLFATKH
jgi:hypothetical protein